MTLCEYPVPPINGACDACMVGFQLLEDAWSYGPTVDEFEFLIGYVCNIFPEGEIKEECK
jgi:hypothetical protein